MASPAHSSHSGATQHRAAVQPRYRRSSFNGAKQLQAAQAPGRRVLLALGLLAVALLVAIGTIAFHLVGSK